MEIIYPEREDLERMHVAEVSCWNELAASLETMRERYEVHPEGYIAAVEGEDVTGFTYGIRYDYDELHPRTWHDAVDLDNHTQDGKDIYIVSLTVAEEFQRQGAGSELMEAAKERAREFGIERIVLGSRAGTVDFFEKCGFERVERIEEWWPEDEESDGVGVVMEYVLDQG